MKGDIIRAEGVRFGFPSSGPQARKPLGLRRDIRSQVHAAAPGPVFLNARRHLLPAGKNRLAPWQKRVHLAVVLDHFWRAK